MVLPAPAAPSTRSIALPERVSASTISCCSSLRSGCSQKTTSSMIGFTSPAVVERSASTRSSKCRSVANRSGVVHRDGAGIDFAVRSAIATWSQETPGGSSAIAWPDCRKPSAIAVMSATSAPSGIAAAIASMSSRRPKWDRFAVSPSGPARCANSPGVSGSAGSCRAMPDVSSITCAASRPCASAAASHLGTRSARFRAPCGPGWRRQRPAPRDHRLRRPRRDGLRSRGAASTTPAAASSDTLDLGHALHDRSPLDIETAGQLSPQLRAVHVPGRLRPQVQRLGVQRRPPVLSLDVHQVRHQDMRVQLRVTRTRRAMPERRTNEPVAQELVRAAMPTPRRRCLGLQHRERGVDREVMRCSDLTGHLATPEREQDRHRLRGTERRGRTQGPAVRDVGPRARCPSPGRHRRARQ